MAVKIRCSECRKKIAVDEAFAGSMCRCPYCKSIVQVPRLPGSGDLPGRPPRPSARPGRPSAPRIKSPGGSGLEQVSGSKPIIREPGSTQRKRPVGPTIIETPGIPQVTEPPQRPKAPGGKPAAPKRPHTPAAPKSDAEDPLAALAGTAKTVKNPTAPQPPVEPHEPQPVPVEPPAAQAPSVKAEEDLDVIEAIHVDESQLTREQLAAIPTANPVLLQGIVSLVLIAILLIVGGASVYLGVRVFSVTKVDDSNPGSAYVRGEDPKEEEEIPPNPFLVSTVGPRMCSTVTVLPPVAYVIDGGDAMGDMFLYARDAVRASVRSLGKDHTFGVVVAGESAPIYAGGKMFPGGAEGAAALRPSLLTLFDENDENDENPEDKSALEIAGASELAPAVEKALSLQPKTLVLLVNNAMIENPAALGKDIAYAKARLVLVAFGYEYDEQKESYDALVKASGPGATLLLYSSAQELRSYFDETNLPE